jgi:hypothetical protein
MARLEWDPGELVAGEGLDRGVLYLPSGTVSVWNGLISLDDTSEESTESIYVDGVLYFIARGNNEPKFTLEAFTCPVEFEEDKRFGLSYRTFDRYIHLVYNATATLPSLEFATLAEDTELDTLVWDVVTVPEKTPFGRPTSHLVIDTLGQEPTFVEALENILYGSDSGALPYLPSPAQVSDLFDEHATVVIIDNGDGTWTATGPDSEVSSVGADTFEVSGPTVGFIGDHTYTATSW